MKELNSFDDKIDYLFSPIYKSTNINDYLQPERLDSDKMNLFLNLVEADIDNLYEKTRILEEVLNEVDMYVSSTISDNQDLIYKNLKILESDRDSIKEKLYMERVVDLSGYSTGRDRDGKSLPACEVFNTHITVSGKKVNDILIDKISVSSNSSPNRSNIDDLLSGKPYRAFYMLDSKIKGGINETILSEFNTPTSFNYLTCEPTNCNVDFVEYINENGSTTRDNDIYSVYKSSRRIESLAVGINTTEAYEKTYEIDEERIHGNFWSMVANDSYNTYLTGSASSLDIDKHSGMEQYRKDLQQFKDDTVVWQSEKDAVDAHNRAETSKYNAAMERYSSATSEWERLYG